jgi:hypothetical protein
MTVVGQSGSLMLSPASAVQPFAQSYGLGVVVVIPGKPSRIRA